MAYGFVSCWRYGAVIRNRFVELSTTASSADMETQAHEQSTASLWRVLSGDERGGFIPRIDCVLHSAAGRAMLAEASLGFDSDVLSIAASWIPAEADSASDGNRRAVVACGLRGRCRPAILASTLGSDCCTPFGGERRPLVGASVTAPSLSNSPALHEGGT